MMAAKFVRTPIGVEAIFMPDGSFAPKEVVAYAETLLGEGGIGIYNTFTHIDVRSTKSRWQG